MKSNVLEVVRNNNSYIFTKKNPAKQKFKLSYKKEARTMSGLP